MSKSVGSGKMLLLCAWPGLFQLWHRGAPSGLVLAVGFSVLVNLVLVASFVWTGLLSRQARIAGWGAVLLAWGVSALLTHRIARRQGEAGRSERSERRAGSDAAVVAAEDLFAKAVDEYLACNWYEVERLLHTLLKRDDHDVEARLMLATMCRHTGRLDEAGDQLEQLARCERSKLWWPEIERERDSIEQQRIEQQRIEQQRIEQQRVNLNHSDHGRADDVRVVDVTKAA